MVKEKTRNESLLKELSASGFIKMSVIQSKFGVSQSTARRMCLELEQQGLAVRRIGGLLYMPEKSGISPDSLYQKFRAANLAEKEIIAKYAGDIIESGDIIFISGGTTTNLFAKRLAERIQSGDLHNIVAMTNAFDVADTLGGAAEIIVTGGTYRSSRRDMIGMICEKTLQKSRFNKAFIGVDGIDLENGLMTFDVETARVDQTVLSNAANVYVLTDHTKFERGAFISYAKIHANCVVLTDSGLDERIAKQAAASGVSLVVI